jgi:RimJ/RimL family protein N-acetyltransferase
MRLYESSGLKAAGHLMRVKLGDHESTRTTPRMDVRSANLRPLAPDDIHALCRLWNEAGLPYRPEGRDRIDRLARHLDGKAIGGWGAFQGETLIAAALVSNDGRKGWIERLATSPRFRRAGLARAIVTAGMQSLREDGALVIAALIESENLASCKLFESCGFVNDPGLRYLSIRANPGD